MQGPTTLISSISGESALRDTQIDEYYSDVNPNGFEAADKSLKENPYPGLRPYKTSESIVFFGREGISSELITRLAACRFLAVLGSSGTGKSSLVRAGLLPILETLPGKNGAWKVAICRPGKNPFGNLARAIFSAKITTSYNELEIWKVLSSSSFGYKKIYDSINNSEKYNTLIVIDQFEELFRYRNDYGVSARNDAALFVKMLIDTSQNEALNTYVMITMRSEYLGDCVHIPQLVDAINNGQYLVPRLKSRQLIDVISEPAAFSCATTEEAYASKLTGEIGDSMDQLPVLQHVLRRAYTVAERNPDDASSVLVRYSDYVKVGKMESALDKHANEVYDSLSIKQQEYCKILFQSITDGTTDSRGIRRPLLFSTLLSICKEKEVNNQSVNQVRYDLEIVVNSFRRDNVNFLMPPPHVQLADDLEIDISHESLMRIWKHLQRWIEEEAKDANLLDELIQRDKNDYIKGGKLIIYREWVERKKPGISWASLYRKPDLTGDNYDQRFIDSISLVHRSKQKRKNAIITSIIVGTIILGSLATAFVNLYKSTQLETRNEHLHADSLLIHAKNEALDQKRRELSIINEKLTEQGRKLSESNKALISNNKTITDQANKLTTEINQKQKAMQSLSTALKSLSNARNLLQANYEILDNTQKSLKKAYDSASNLKNLALAIKHSEKSLAIPIYDLKREDIKAQLALKAYQLYQQSGDENKKLLPQVYSALYFALRNKIGHDAFNKDVWPITTYQAGLDHLAYAVMATSPEKRPISYLTAENNKFYSFDFESKRTIVTKNLGAGNKLVGVEASADGRWIAINTLSRKILLIDNYDHQQDTTLTFSGIVRTSKFSVEGSVLYTYTQDSVLSAIDLAHKTRSSQKVKFKIEDIAISNTHIYGLTTNGDVIKWNKNNSLAQDPEIIVSPNKEKLVRGTAISCKPDNSLAIWGNENGQVFYKNESQKAEYLTRFGGPITSIAFNSSFNLVALSSYDKTVQVFNLPNLQAEVPLNLNNNEGPVTSLFFQRDTEGKEKLVAVISPGLIRVYPMDLETLACKLYEFYKDRQPPPEEWDKYIDKAVENRKVEITCK